MRKYRNKSPEEIMKMVTEEIIDRAVIFSRKKKRTITISKTSGGKGIDVCTLDRRSAEGRRNRADFLKTVMRNYTVAGLGSPEEKNAVNWRKLNLSFWRRSLLVMQVAISFFLKGNAFKNSFLRWMGVHIGRNTEIMQMVWLDHFRPELIFIGDNSLLGAFTRITVHAYEGGGKFRYSLVEVGSNCTIGAGTGIGAIRIEDNVRTLPGTTVSPYLVRIRAGSVVGWSPPTVQRSAEKEKNGGERTAGETNEESAQPAASQASK